MRFQKRCWWRPDDGLVKDADQVLNGADLGVSKFGKRGSRSGMQKDVGKGTGRNYGDIGRGCLGHQTGHRETLHGLGNALDTGGRDVHPLAPVVFHGATQVRTIDAVGSPCAPLVWCFLH